MEADSFKCKNKYHSVDNYEKPATNKAQPP